MQQVSLRFWASGVPAWETSSTWLIMRFKAWRANFCTKGGGEKAAFAACQGASSLP